MNLKCPFCGREINIVILDDEFNIKNEEYEKNPYSGLQYGLSHEYHPDIFCPIATEEGEILGGSSYISKEVAAEIWNKRID